ncbi:hypothetical protein SteCoe_10090 [Stentor coeruleus]|uniref:Rab-GAP TBC domain-containing protein n=1 Tax=Stentor coeruleus TaxID=5963 RepID=A0A1R2CG73_9CILI|nr:hypothetical protein SteCoe_10090 [Stentor coeruleus]
MDEKIYCWGFLSDEKNSAEPIELKAIPHYEGLYINRRCKYIWSENCLYSWGDSLLEPPEVLLKTSEKIIKASYGINSPLVQTNLKPVLSGTFKDDISEVFGTSSGHAYLTKAMEVKSWDSGNTILSRIASVDAECCDFFALNLDGDVYKWAHIHIPKKIFIMEPIMTISCGAQHSVFTSSSEHVYVVGSNVYGQISIGDIQSTEHPILLEGITAKKVVCGGFHTVLLGKDNLLYSCGLGNMGQLINSNFSNINTLTLCTINEDLGEILDVYCSELTSFVRFSHKFDAGISSFRPGNLQKKNIIETFLHRQQVAAAERNYLQKVENEEKNRNEMIKKQLKREKRIQKALREFEINIIPNWSMVKFSKEVNEHVKNGIPSKFRGKIWALLVGNDNRVSEEDFKEGLKKAKRIEAQAITVEDKNILENSLKIISLDITRTFNNLGYFSEESPLNKDLQELLEAACIYRADIGYIQGMSYVAGCLLLNLDLIQAFQIFISIITSPILLPFYKIDQEGIQVREEIFTGLLKENIIELQEHFDLQGVQPAIFLMEWFVTLYSKTLSQEVALRVWDIYFYFGEITLFKTGIAILQLVSQELLEYDLSGIMDCLSHLAVYVKEPDELINQIDHVRIPETFVRQVHNL